MVSKVKYRLLKKKIAYSSSFLLFCGYITVRLKELVFSVLCLLLLLSSCKDNHPREEVRGIGLVNIPLSHSRYFSIGKLERDMSVVKIYADPEQKTLSSTFLLVPKDSLVPAWAKDSAWYVVRTPVQRTICLSSLYVAHLGALDQTAGLLGIDDKRYVNNAAVVRKVQEKSIAEVGGNYNLQLEKVIALQPDLVLTYAEAGSDRKRFAELGIPLLAAYDYMESSPLARAEWIKVTAAFFDMEQKADSLFTVIEKEYGILAELGRNAKFRPGVMTELKYNDVWHVSGGKSYFSVLLKDAGARYVWDDDEHAGTMALNFEQVYAKAHDADFWIHVQHWKSLADALREDERYKNFKAWKAGNIYNNDARSNSFGGNDFWESGLLHPHYILRDLLTIFHPELMQQDTLLYYRRLK